jgi:hypothetical protein
MAQFIGRCINLQSTLRYRIQQLRYLIDAIELKWENAGGR